MVGRLINLIDCGLKVPRSEVVLLRECRLKTFKLGFKISEVNLLCHYNCQLRVPTCVCAAIYHGSVHGPTNEAKASFVDEIKVTDSVMYKNYAYPIRICELIRRSLGNRNPQ